MAAEIDKTDQHIVVDGVNFNWTLSCDNLWELLTALLLDTRTPLERVKFVIDSLKAYDMLDFRKLHELTQHNGTGAVAELLKSLGYPWYNQKAAFFAQDIRIDLATADFELIQTVRGVGPKLASLWMRIVHNEDLPIIDTHVKKWIRANGYKGTDSYKAMAIFFQKEAGRRGVSVEELDRSIVTEGIKRRRGLE